MSNLAEQMQADALEAQRFSRKHLVLELDFSPASIGELEAQIDAVEYAIPGGMSPENVDLLTRIWGAYLGETLRRRAGGQWVRQDDGRVVLQGAAQAVFPHEQVRQRLLAGDTHNLTSYFEDTLPQL